MARSREGPHKTSFPLIVGAAAVCVSLTALVAQAATPTASPTQRYCATPTPEPLSVDPVGSPTDELTQTVYVRTGNADRLEVSSEAGTFMGEFPFDRVNVSLLPNTANHLRVSVHVRPIVQDGCMYGDYTLSTTTDFHGAPLTIVQGTTFGPTIAVEPSGITLQCSSDFEIKLRNASEGNDVLKISYVSLHHAYSQGDYGTDFTWDTSAIELPLTLAPGAAVSIPVSYRGTGLFNSRLVLQVVSNARNNRATQYVAYAGKRCPTPTPTESIEAATPTPTSTPHELCAPLSSVAPPSGPARSVVMIQGLCYPMHSGRGADVFLDDTLIGRVSGSTAGDFDTLLFIPPGTSPGSHVIRLRQDDVFELTSGRFDVSLPPGFCVGDCDQDGRVDVSEVVTQLGIALGRLDPRDCLGLGSAAEDLTVAHIVGAVRNALEGCPIAPDLESFAGAYDVFVGAVSELAFPAPLRNDLGEASVLEGALFLAFEYFPGKFELHGIVAADGSVMLDGVFVQNETEPVEVAGSAVLNQTEAGEWIGGELLFDPPGPLDSQALRFSMQR